MVEKSGKYIGIAKKYDQVGSPPWIDITKLPLSTLAARRGPPVGSTAEGSIFKAPLSDPIYSCAHDVVSIYLLI